MAAVIKTHLIKIGNSQGIRIPKVLLDQVDLNGEIELEAQPGQLVIRRGQHPRDGWDKQFRKMAELHDDYLVDSEVAAATRWDEEEWEW